MIEKKSLLLDRKEVFATHIVFAPKYRRQEIYRKIKQDIGQILRKLCEAKQVEILEAEACPDHSHSLWDI